MHPDLYLIVYRQAERELEQRLAYQLAARARAVEGPPRPRRRTASEVVRAARAALRPAPRSVRPVCCTA